MVGPCVGLPWVEVHHPLGNFEMLMLDLVHAAQAPLVHCCQLPFVVSLCLCLKCGLALA